jgi:hypothetical protein
VVRIACGGEVAVLVRAGVVGVGQGLIGDAAQGERSRGDAVRGVIAVVGEGAAGVVCGECVGDAGAGAVRSNVVRSFACKT